MTKVQVREAATLLCIRQRSEGSIATLKPDDYRFSTSTYQTLETLGRSVQKSGVHGMVWEFHNNFEILWGQGEVVNWVNTESPKAAIYMEIYGNNIL